MEPQINYTNEKLHQAFIDQVFEGEKKVYREEGLDDSAIAFTDNAMVLEMMSGHNPHDIRKGLAKAEVSKKVKTSLIGVLDDVCKQDKNDGTTYCERAAKQWNGKKDANGPLFEGPKFGAEEFTVIHFAGPVKYGTTEVDKVKFLPPSMWEKNGIDLKCPQIESFVTKNKDKVPQSLLDFFSEKAGNEYFLHIDKRRKARLAEAERAGGGAAASPGKSPGAGPKTIVSKFNVEIEAFFKTLLTGADPKFIRTINPRPKGIPAPPTMGQRFNLQRVLTQLKYTGILDTVRVRASGYIIRKKYEEFAHTWVFPCNLLPDDCPLQAGMQKKEFAEKLQGDPDLSKEVIRLLFSQPEYAVNVADEVLEGKTMIFIKKLSTIVKLNERKEQMMIEVAQIAKAEVQMAALALRWYRHSHAPDGLPLATTGCWSGSAYQRKVKAATKLQASYRTWLTIYGKGQHPGVRGVKSLWSKKGAWVSIIALKKQFGDAMPLAEGWGMGYLARRKDSPFAARKAEAIADGQWNVGGRGGGLLGQRKRRGRSRAAPGADAAAIKMNGDFDRVFGGVAAKTEAGAHRMGARPDAMRAALAAAAAEAARACPRSKDEAKLRMLTREYIAADNLQFQLGRAVKLLHEERPARDELQRFLLAALRGERPESSRREDGSGGRATDYIDRNGGFALLKPALFAVAKHRPDDAKEYVSTFLTTAIRSLS